MNEGLAAMPTDTPQPTPEATGFPNTQGQFQADAGRQFFPEDSGREMDPERARVMALASTEQEVAVVDARNAAVDAANNIGNSRFRSSENRGPEHEARHQSELAQQARAAADTHARSAAEVYDAVNNL